MTSGRYIGCMTGTSVDGLDLALVEITRSTGTTTGDDQVKLLHAQTLPIPQPLRDWLLSCGQPSESSVEMLGRCDSALGEFIGQSVKLWLENLNIDRASVTAIGSHGQTVRHRPPGQGEHPFTLQIGDPNRIAEHTGIDTVADFRRRDMAAGGQGAPLAPAFHRVLFRQAPSTTCIVNIGGISNISPLGNLQRGFDSGPGNCLLDDWYVRNHPSAPMRFDPSGTWAASGQIHPHLLEQLLADAYFYQTPPKSTGREYFNLTWLQQHLTTLDENVPAEDIQATLAELTAVSLARAIASSCANVIDVPICGGGRYNVHLTLRISAALSMLGKESCCVKPSEHWQVDGDSVESAAFAWLAYRRISQRPANLPEVTGALGHRVLGAIYPAR